MYRNILIATDGSAISNRAVSHGVRLAKALNAEVTAMTVTAPYASLGVASHAFSGECNEFRRQALEYIEEEARQTLEAAKSVATAEGVAIQTKAIDADHAHEAIVATATELGSDLIIMGSHGRSGVAALLLGSVTQKVLTQTTLPVLVCR